MTLRKWIKYTGLISTVLYISAIALIYLDAFSKLETGPATAIVFGNKVHEDGTLSNRLKARLDAAYTLYQNKLTQHIVVSGGVGKEGYDEATVMARYLIKKGIPKQIITIDSLGTNTSKTSRNAVKLLPSSSAVIAVTQQFHISRAKLSLRNAGFKSVYGHFPRFYELRDIYSAIREVPAWLKYWIKSA